MFLPQEFIHNLEHGRWSRLVQMAFFALVIAALAALYNFRSFHNFSTPEGMDAAQLARNLAEGRGYVTDNITPLSIHLVSRHHERQLEERSRRGDTIEPDAWQDPAKLQGGHPDLQNAPLYPWLLSLGMKALPFQYEIPTGDRDWRIHQPDMMITVLNQALFILNALMVFVIARRLFDHWIAWTAMLLFIGTDLFWQISISGQSTLLLEFWFLLLIWLLVRLENGVSEEEWSVSRTFLVAVVIGLVLAAGMLTRYAFGFLVVPVLVFVGLYAGHRRIIAAIACLLVFAAAMTPWIMRNYDVSGTPFGTAGYAVFQETDLLPGDELPRSLEPNYGGIGFDNYLRKFKSISAGIVVNDLPRLGGTWLTAFFLVGLFIPFQRPALNRIRGFLLMCLLLFVVVQALGTTWISDLSPTVNTENLLVLLAPMVIVFGVSLFFLLIEQWELPTPGLRILVTVMFGIVVSLPLFYSLATRTFPIVHPYHPQRLYLTSNWLRESEQLMTDSPWASAWYGNRQSILWTLNPNEAFYQIHDFLKPVNALYLSPRALNLPFHSQLMSGPGQNWGRYFLGDFYFDAEISREFPLKHSPRFWPEEEPEQRFDLEFIFLSDRIRW